MALFILFVFVNCAADAFAVLGHSGSHELYRFDMHAELTIGLVLCSVSTQLLLSRSAEVERPLFTIPLP